MSADNRAEYLESGQGDLVGSERLDMIRELLADSTTWSEPPPGLAEGVARRIGVRPIEVEVPRSRRWLVPAAAAAVAMLLGFFALISNSPDEPNPPDAVATLQGTNLEPGAEGTATIRDMSSGWSIYLHVAGLPPAPAGMYYQGWAWNNTGEGVSIGTFHLRDGAYPVTLWAGVDLVEYPAIWVTLQEEGAGNEVSDRVVMRGRIEGLGD